MLNLRVIQFASLIVIGAGALAMSTRATATTTTCGEGTIICQGDCPGNLTLACQIFAGCTPGNPPFAYCNTSTGCIHCDGSQWPN